MFDRETQVVSCRHGKGMGRGGGMAGRGTLSEAGREEVIVVAMSPGRRHITKPICELTFGLREAKIQVSVLILYSGSGIPDVGMASGSFNINTEELAQIARHKVAVIHVGSVKDHILKKIRAILEGVDIPTIVVCQSPVDFEDFAKVGVKTKFVKPMDKNILTKGTVMEIVSGVTRGEPTTIDKLNELVRAVKNTLNKTEILNRRIYYGI